MDKYAMNMIQCDVPDHSQQVEAYEERLFFLPVSTFFPPSRHSSPSHMAEREMDDDGQNFHKGFY